MDPSFINACNGKCKKDGGLNVHDFKKRLSEELPTYANIIKTARRKELEEICQKYLLSIKKKVNTMRILIIGASGSGVTTLGHALANALNISHYDTDDYYWLPSIPPYQVKRDIPSRLHMMHEQFLLQPAWVLSGSLDPWGNELKDFFDLVIFLYTPTNIRISRLHDREARRLGIGLNDQLPDETMKFIEWSSHYDDCTREGRCLARHEVWLKSLSCPILRLDGTQPVINLIAQVLEVI